MTDVIIKSLSEIVGKKNLILSKTKMAGYINSWRDTSGDCKAIIIPESLKSMWKVLEILVAYKKVILIQAANTSLTGGSTPNGKYDRELFIINTKKIKSIYILDQAKQILALPGSTLYDLEKKLKPFNRAPHSEIGSSCIGASIVGGICNNSGGALIKRGPAYTEMSLFAKVNEDGKLELVNKLNIDLGKTELEILDKLDQGKIDLKDCIPTNAKASCFNYKEILKDTKANTPARYNANKNNLYDASGCAGKVAVFAVRLDTFKKEEGESVFYLSTNSSKDLTKLKNDILTKIDDLPTYAEYMHSNVYEVSKNFGRDAFYLIYFFGTDAMPFFYKTRNIIDKFLKKFKFLSYNALENILQKLSYILPNIMPKKFDDLNKRYEHHLILKCDNKSVKDIERIITRNFNSSKKNSFIHCSSKESKKLILNRFVTAGATIRYAKINRKANSELLALDIAYKRSEKNWEEHLPEKIRKNILKSFNYGHFFCNVFHRDYVLKKKASLTAVKYDLLSRLKDMGAKYPAEHNVGHMYEAEKDLEMFYKKLDPTNTFNPGIGKTSKLKKYK